jgi:Na+/phosphate symporter
MKHVYSTALTLFLCLLVLGVAQAQTEMQQRVERYLYSNYNTNKAALRENERIIRILEEKLDTYLVSADKETQRKAVTQEKEIKQMLLQIEKITDPKVLRNMIEEARTKQIANLDRFVNGGLSSPEDALECRRIIVMKLVEHDLITQKQEKLLALLKDDHSRSQFIEGILKKKNLQDGIDLKTFAKSVDGEVDMFSL